MGRRFKQFEESLYLNKLYYDYYFQAIQEYAISSFKYENMPDTCDVRFLEMAFFKKGAAVFFQEDVTGDFLTLIAVGGSSLDMYGNWARYYGKGAATYRSRDLTPADSVLMFNNMNHTGGWMIADKFARELSEIDRTISVNLRNTRQPKLILCDQNQKESMKQLIMQVDGGYNNIFADKTFDLEAIRVLDTGAPYLVDKLQEEKKEKWSECMERLGIPSNTVNKKERFVTDEILVSQGGTISARNSRLFERQKACDKINEMFGLDLTVDFNDAYLAELQADEEEPEQKEGEAVE